MTKFYLPRYISREVGISLVPSSIKSLPASWISSPHRHNGGIAQINPVMDKREPVKVYVGRPRTCVKRINLMSIYDLPTLFVLLHPIIEGTTNIKSFRHCEIL